MRRCIGLSRWGGIGWRCGVEPELTTPIVNKIAG
jgi:hypothetical protein